MMTKKHLLLAALLIAGWFFSASALAVVGQEAPPAAYDGILVKFKPGVS